MKLISTSTLKHFQNSILERMAYEALSLRNSAISAVKSHGACSWNVVVLRKGARRESCWILIVQVSDGQETRVFDYGPSCFGAPGLAVARELFADGSWYWIPSERLQDPEVRTVTVCDLTVIYNQNKSHVIESVLCSARVGSERKDGKRTAS